MNTKFVVNTAEDLHRTLALARIERGLTQEELSELTGIERSYVSRLEGSASSTQLTRLVSSLRFLGVTISAELVPEQQWHYRNLTPKRD